MTATATTDAVTWFDRAAARLWPDLPTPLLTELDGYDDVDAAAFARRHRSAACAVVAAAYMLSLEPGDGRSANRIRLSMPVPGRPTSLLHTPALGTLKRAFPDVDFLQTGVVELGNLVVRGAKEAWPVGCGPDGHQGRVDIVLATAALAACVLPALRDAATDDRWPDPAALGPLAELAASDDHRLVFTMCLFHPEQTGLPDELVATMCRFADSPAGVTFRSRLADSDALPDHVRAAYALGVPAGRDVA